MRDEPAPVEDGDVVHDLAELGEQVARHEDGAALVGQGAEQTAQPVHAQRVEPVGRLVEHECGRVSQER